MKYQIIRISNKEPLKIGSGGTKEGQKEPCKDYIPGSTLRGAVIGQLLRLNICKEDELPPILDQMICYNAYPYRHNRLYTPTPLHLRLNKHEWRKQRALSSNLDNKKVELYNLPTDHSKDAKNNIPFQFVARKDGYLQGIRVAKAYTQHHSQVRNRDSKEKANLFNYQAILPDQMFQAIIAYSEDIEKSITAMFEQASIWYLGGSKGSGYGRCEIEIVGEATSDFIKAKELLGFVPSPALTDLDDPSLMKDTIESDLSKHVNRIVITCLSDCLFRNEFGQPVPYIPIAELQQLVDAPVSLQLVHQYVLTGISAGYNAKWQARYPKESVLKAGSILVYEIEGIESSVSVEVVNQLIRRLEQQPVGYRIQDGYGWLAVNVSYPSQLQVSEASEESIDSWDRRLDKTELSFKAMQEDPDSQIVFQILNKGLDRKRVRWLQFIFERSSQKDGHQSIVVNIQSRHHYNNMVAVIRSGSFDADHYLDRDYMKNNAKFSIEGCNFSEICQFINNKENSTQNEKLNSFVKRMLGSKSGRLHYGDPAVFENRQKFVKEILEEGLLLSARRHEK